MSLSESPVRTKVEEDGSLLRLTLARPTANILDTEMIGALRAALAGPGSAPELKSILFNAEGKHFSFGASVEEHGPAEVDRMLPVFHALFRDLAASGKVLLAAVSGLCLGGGLELAPMASVVLPHRVGQPVADDLLLTGRNLGADEALKVRLIDELVEDPSAAALAWHRDHIAPLSALSIRHAIAAARLRLHRDLEQTLSEIEDRYLNQLMKSHDAPEGITAFLEKRAPVWKHS